MAFLMTKIVSKKIIKKINRIERDNTVLQPIDIIDFFGQFSGRAFPPFLDTTAESVLFDNLPLR